MWKETTYDFPCIDHVSMEKLGKDIIYDEIKHVVFYMNPWKAPGLDGFPVGVLPKFVECYWQESLWTHKEDVWQS